MEQVLSGIFCPNHSRPAQATSQVLLLLSQRSSSLIGVALTAQLLDILHRIVYLEKIQKKITNKYCKNFQKHLQGFNILGKHF